MQQSMWSCWVIFALQKLGPRPNSVTVEGFERMCQKKRAKVESRAWAGELCQKIGYLYYIVLGKYNNLYTSCFQRCDETLCHSSMDVIYRKQKHIYNVIREALGLISSLHLL